MVEEGLMEVGNYKLDIKKYYGYDGGMRVSQVPIVK